MNETRSGAEEVEYEWAVRAPDGFVHAVSTQAFGEHVSINGEGYVLMRRPVADWEDVEQFSVEGGGPGAERVTAVPQGYDGPSPSAGASWARVHQWTAAAWQQWVKPTAPVVLALVWAWAWVR